MYVDPAQFQKKINEKENENKYYVKSSIIDRRYIEVSVLTKN